MTDALIEGMGHAAEIGFDETEAVRLVGETLPWFAGIVVPFAAVGFVVALATNLAQIGFIASGESLKPDFNKLNPARGLQRILSLRSLTKTGFGLFKVSLVGAILIWTLWEEATREDGESLWLLLGGAEWEAVGYYAVHVVVVMGLRGSVALLILAALDFAYQRWQHEKDLMMTKQEVREEMLRLEGDPKIKERRRRIQQQLAFQRMMHEVPRADVVVTNPTHVAVAIRYERRTMAAPRCIAKGEGYVARRIREVAMENGVPTVERPELARALFKAVEVGQEVPPEFYRAVAELLAYVYKLARRGSGAARTVA